MNEGDIRNMGCIQLYAVAFGIRAPELARQPSRAPRDRKDGTWHIYALFYEGVDLGERPGLRSGCQRDRLVGMVSVSDRSVLCKA